MNIDSLECRSQVKAELDVIRNAPFPTIESDINLVWVLSGPQLSFLESDGEINLTMNRLKTGIYISRKLAALKRGVELVDLTAEDVEKHGPAVLFNGYNEQNWDLLSLRASGYFEQKFRFPGKRIVIAFEQDQVKHTNDQLAELPPHYIPEDGKIAIVTDGFHIPRVDRYLRRADTPVSVDRVVVFPAQPLYMPADLCLREMMKIPRYREKGDL